MGLDMYLSKKTYVKRWDHMTADELFTVSVKKGGKKYPSIDYKRVSYVVEEVAYWRKANAIHKWFVDNVQDGKDDCGHYYVEKDKLKELLTAINAVLGDNTKAKELLPPQGGFFFGNTGIDEYYVQDLQYTKETLEKLLAEGGEGDFEYRSSW